MPCNRAGCPSPTIEVRFDGLRVEAEVFADQSRNLPSILNAYRDTIEVCASFIHERVLPMALSSLFPSLFPPVSIRSSPDSQGFRFTQWPWAACVGDVLSSPVQTSPTLSSNPMTLAAHIGGSSSRLLHSLTYVRSSHMFSQRNLIGWDTNAEVQEDPDLNLKPGRLFLTQWVVGQSILVKARLLRPARRKLVILKDLSGAIPAGRLTLLLGPPSCGKSTLLKALAGKLQRSSDLKVSLPFPFPSFVCVCVCVCGVCV